MVYVLPTKREVIDIVMSFEESPLYKDIDPQHLRLLFPTIQGYLYEILTLSVTKQDLSI